MNSDTATHADMSVLSGRTSLPDPLTTAQRKYHVYVLRGSNPTDHVSLVFRPHDDQGAPLEYFHTAELILNPNRCDMRATSCRSRQFQIQTNK